MNLTESNVEDAALEWFGELGYAIGIGPRLAPGERAAERDSFSEVVLVERLRRAIRRLNPAIPDETRDGFLVRTGSGAVRDAVPSCHAYLKELRSALITNGVLKSSGDGYIFAQDYVFASPSTAAGVVQGRAANGRVDWKTKDGKTGSTFVMGKGRCRGATLDFSQTRQCLVSRPTNSCVLKGRRDFPCPFRTFSFLAQVPGTLCRANVQRRSATAEGRLEDFTNNKRRGTEKPLRTFRKQGLRNECRRPIAGPRHPA